MIAKDKFSLVEELLRKRTLSHRQIAQQVGVSRRWVDGVARGQFEQSDERTDVHDDRPPLADPEDEPARCLICGAKVYLPCVVCTLRAGPLKE